MLTDKFRHGVLALLDTRYGTQRMQKPVPEFAAAHARTRHIEHGEDGSLFPAFENILYQLQVSLGLRVQHNKLFTTIRLRRLQMREKGLLRLLYISKQSAGGKQ